MTAAAHMHAAQYDLFHLADGLSAWHACSARHEIGDAMCLELPVLAMIADAHMHAAQQHALTCIMQRLPATACLHSVARFGDDYTSDGSLRMWYVCVHAWKFDLNY
jgi:hypothetical protein